VANRFGERQDLRCAGSPGGHTVQENHVVMRSRHLGPIPRTNLTEEIVTRFVSLILDEGLKPGDKLPSVRELVEQFSVGRSSLREAIRILSAIGVIDVSVGEGMSVGQGDLSLIARPLTLGLLMGEQSRNDLIETRRLIEVQMAGLAAERATDAEIATISRHLETMRTSQDDHARYSTADLEFHLAIARASHNQLLYNLLHTLRHILGALIAKVVVDYDANHMPQSFRVHLPIFAAIRSRKGQAARQAMAVHLDRLEERLTLAISRGLTSEKEPAPTSGQRPNEKPQKRRMPG
jgi:GntR family transcriptional regulator, transcriptional repressor for pyruvate dehydrogenase complex